VDVDTSDGRSCRLTLDYAEMVALHEVIVRAEWADELNVIEIRSNAEQLVLSRLQLALAPLVRELGTSDYNAAVESALRQVIDSSVQ
jgi:hypothetical protein